MAQSEMLSAGDSTLLKNSLDLVDEWLSRRVDSTPQPEKKNYQNYLSHFRKYVNYLCGLDVNENEGDAVTLGRASKSKVYLIDEYKHWLEDSVDGLGTDDAISSYLSTLRSPKAMDWVKKDVQFKFSTTTEVSPFNTTAIILEVNTLIAAITDRLEKTRAKELSDQRSHLRKYLRFLREHLANSAKPHSVGVDNIDEEDDSQTLPLNILSGESDQVYEKEDLQNNFYWRLTTQDRLTKQEGQSTILYAFWESFSPTPLPNTKSFSSQRSKSK